MFVLLCASLFGLSLAAKPPTQNPLYIVDPLNSPSHGVIFSSDHVVLKVDCPGCPVFDTAWDTKATSLIFDFTLSSDPKDPTKPIILLNDDSFFPRTHELGWTGFTEHTARPVPWTTTLEDYLAAPNAHDTTDLVAAVEPLAVNNTLGRNLTAVLLLTVAYGNDKNDTFENFNGNVSAVELFYQTEAYWSETRDHNGTITHAGTRERWTLEWWQIVPFALLYNRTVTTDPPSVEIPSALKFKLQGYVPTVHDGGFMTYASVQPVLQDLLSWVHFLGAVVIIAIVVGVFTAVWWVFGEEILKLQVWDDLRKWWNERMKKQEADGGENAPLLAGGQDNEA